MIFSAFRSIVFLKACMRASVKLHNLMFSAVIRGVMDFFYKNSSGRILNRFAKDIGSVDDGVPSAFMDTLQVSSSFYEV